MLESVVEALLPGIERRTLPPVGNELDALPQSLKRMRNAFSLSGTVKCTSQLQPSVKLLSATAVVLTALAPVNASGVVDAFELVTKLISLDFTVVLLPTPEATWKWYVDEGERLLRVTECDVPMVLSSIVDKPYAEVGP